MTLEKYTRFDVFAYRTLKVLLSKNSRLLVGLTVLLGFACLFSDGLRAYVFFLWGKYYMALIGIAILGGYLASFLGKRHPELPDAKNASLVSFDGWAKNTQYIRRLVIIFLLMEFMLVAFLNAISLVFLLWIFNLVFIK